MAPPLSARLALSCVAGTFFPVGTFFLFCFSFVASTYFPSASHGLDAWKPTPLASPFQMGKVIFRFSDEV